MEDLKTGGKGTKHRGGRVGEGVENRLEREKEGKLRNEEWNMGEKGRRKRGR